MKMKLVTDHAGAMSRRKLIQLIGSAGLAVASSPLATATRVQSPVCYGYGPGKTSLKPETIFPLLAAWLLLTTNGNYVLDEQTISCATNLHPDSAKAIKQSYDDNAMEFGRVRTAFETLVRKFSEGERQPFYSGGQCPKDPDTVTPIAALFGTPTTVKCKQLQRSASKKETKHMKEKKK